MAKESKIIQNRYFPHDVEASSDEKFIAMNYFFRRCEDTQILNALDKSFLPYAAYGLYWKIIEHIHKHKIQTDKLYILADEWRIDEKFLKLVLNEFNLFQIQDDCYISKRVLKNFEEQEKRSEIARQNVQRRYAQQNQKPKEKTEEEKEALRKAIGFLNESENLPLNQQFTSMYSQYQKLDEINRMKALEFYKEINKTESKKVSINKMLEFIKGGFQDEPQE
jgi:hypothetical protein